MALLIARLVILIASLECAHGNSLQREGNTQHLVLSFSRCSDEVLFLKREHLIVNSLLQSKYFFDKRVATPGAYKTYKKLAVANFLSAKVKL